MLRVLQSRGSHAWLRRPGFPSNLTDATALTRRTRNSLRGPSFRFGDLFTACYSAIFGAAVLADAERKHTRLQQWDRAIAFMEEECKVFENPHTVPAEALPDHDPLRKEEQKLPVLHRARPGQKRAGRYLDAHVSWSPEGIPLESSYDSPTRSQLRKTERSVAKLVVGLLLETSKVLKDDVVHRTKSGRISSQDIMQIDRTISKLKLTHAYLKSVQHQTRYRMKNGHYLPSYEKNNEANHPSHGGYRHNQMRMAYDEYRKGRHHFEDFVGRVCRLLMLDDSPPSVDTFNLLILQFTAMRLFSMVGLVLNSFFECGLMHTVVTITAIIKYLRASKNGREFVLFLHRMRGYAGGLGPKIAQSDLLKVDVRALLNSNLAFLPNKMVAKRAPFNTHVFGAIIEACLDFDLPDEAAKWSQEMIRAGYEADLPILTSMLYACIKTRDWKTGSSVWDSMQAFELDGIAFLNMLCLCRACGREAEFQRVYRQALNADFQEVDAFSVDKREDASSMLFSVKNGNRILKLRKPKKYGIRAFKHGRPCQHAVSQAWSGVAVREPLRTRLLGEEQAALKGSD
ncbi:MAG: hypothetical protein M1815_005998 [Lichina confinis]|nr:MAG: hypothetical protein M1815_005998 [Lichina confinis]